MKEIGNSTTSLNDSNIIDNTQNSFNKNNPENILINLPIDENNNETNEEDEKGEAEKNLMFEIKKIYPFRLYYHISGKFEIFLMVVGAIFTIGAGCTGALVSLLVGDTVNDFTDTSEIEGLPDNEYKSIINKVEPSINNMIYQVSFQKDFLQYLTKIKMVF